MDYIVESVCWDFPCADVTIAHHALHFEYVFLISLFFEKGRQIPLNQWSCTWRARFHQLQVEMLLVVECSAIGITVNKLGIL